MKRILTTLLISFMLVSLMAYAFRVNAQFLTAGLKGGVNLSQVNGSTTGTTFRFRNNDYRATGLVGGVFVRVGNSFYVQPEALLSRKGGRLESADPSDPTGDLDLRFTNLDVPVLVGVKLGDVLRLNAGPMASFNLGEGNVRDQLTNWYAGVSQSPSPSETIRKAIVGYQAGVGFDFGSLQLDLRYEGAFSDLIRSQNAGTGLNVRSNLWQATLGYALF